MTKRTGNLKILEEALRLMGTESEKIETYRLTANQIKAINEARDQIKKGEFLTEEQANKDIDEWLNP